MITNFLEWKNNHKKMGDGKLMEGRIHSIDSFGTLEGPGIRFIVFMQGCKMRCKYCHNRDTWFPNCGKLYTADDLLKEVLKYKNYFDYSGGGVTVSGGEATNQMEFLIEFFSKAKEAGIHTCLDTAGNIDIEKIEPLLKYTDLVLLDIKHMDDEKHKWLTGVSNEKILKLARYLNDNNIRTWIRHVLVPGITDDIKHLNSLGEFLQELPNIEKIEFLPYHSMGKYKWYELGLTYELEHIREATLMDVLRAEEIINSINNRHL